MSNSRRNFVKKLAVSSAGLAVSGMAMGLSPKSYRRIIGANERLNIAVMGTNSRGGHLASVFHNAKGTSLMYICDVDKRVLDKTVKKVHEQSGSMPKASNDIRKVLDDKDVDVLVVATPDHWHAPASIMALNAGKHVYVEKPCSHNPLEGEMLAIAQRKHGKVVQMGNQQRSSPESIEIIGEIHNGIIGDVYSAYTWYSNQRKTIGNGKVVPVPDWLDWELWQGPAPRQDYHDNYVHYNWHWFWHWGTGETCNNATHELDIARWALGVNFPVKVEVNGGRNFYKEDDWEMYDTLNASFLFEGGKSITWDGQSCNAMQKWGRGRGTVIYGTKGTVLLDRSTYILYDLAGKPVRTVNAESRSATTDLVGAGGNDDRHVHNFLETIRGKTEKQNSPINEGHKSVLLCHLANIAYRTGKDLTCDPKNGHIKDKKAMKLWSRKYERKWEPLV